MSKRVYVPILFERSRLLSRTSEAELWFGTLEDRPYLLKRHRRQKKDCWNQFHLQSKIHHSIFLRPERAGFSAAGIFCQAFPLDFTPEPLKEPWDELDFATGLLSLLIALIQRKLVPRWDSNHLIFNSQTRTIRLAGFTSLQQEQSTDRTRNESDQLVRLRKFLSNHRRSALDPIIRKWERRKTGALQGCLAELLSIKATPDHLVTFLEWPWRKEKELVNGLLHMADRSSGRALLFMADSGEGKSNILEQIHKEVLNRPVIATRISASKNAAPYQTIRRLLEQYVEQAVARKRWRAGATLTPFITGSKTVPEEQLESELLKFFNRLKEESNQVSLFLIDDVDFVDPASLRFLNHLFQEIALYPVLFVMTSRKEFDNFQHPVIRFPLEPAAYSQIEASYSIALWKEEQRKSFLSQIHQRTGGNGLLIREYLAETVRLKWTNSLEWSDGEWFFVRPDIPSFPDSLIDFYLNQIPEMNGSIRTFLESAAVQGETFNAQLIEIQEEEKSHCLSQLLKDQIIVAADGCFRFKKQLLAKAIYKRIDHDRKQMLHNDLAEKYLEGNTTDSDLTVARHYLKAGRASNSLAFIRQALRNGPPGVELLALPLLEDFGPEIDALSDGERCDLFLLKADLLFHRGRYASACHSYENALRVSNDRERTFEIAAKLADSYLMDQNIHAAIKVLQQHENLASSIRNEKSLFQYFFVKAICLWHRGPRNPDLFERAFEIAESARDYQSLAEGNRRYASALLQDGSLKDAKILARKSLRFARKVADANEIGHSYRILASIAWRQSKHHVAERFWKRSIHAHKQVSNYYGLALAWNLSANVLIEQYKFSDAIKSFQRSIRILNRLDNKMEVTLAQFNLGLVYLELGNLKEAERIFIKCKSVDQASGNRRYYAYDLRALAGVCILKGFYKKAGRLLKRTLEICEDLHAETDSLQTRMILLLSELEQRNYRQAQPLVSILEKQVTAVTEPFTRAEMCYLLAHYYGYINETRLALNYIEQSVSGARKIRYFKLIGKNLILRLIFKNHLPSRNDPDLKEAMRCFARSKSEMEFYDYLLKLLHAYPALCEKKSFMPKLQRMEQLYRSIPNRSKYNLIRRLRQSRKKHSGSEPMYEWWQNLVRILSSEGSVESRFQKVLAELSHQFEASFSLLYYLNSNGTYDHLRTETDAAEASVNFPSYLLERSLRSGEAFCADPQQDSDLMRTSWIVLHEVRSILAIPIVRNHHVLAVWYFERRGEDFPFAHKDLKKGIFFASVCSSLIDDAMRARESLVPTGITEPMEGLIGASKGMQSVYRQVRKVAPVDINILIAGESGTGKEMIARSLHQKSKRSQGPMLAINCSAIPETLIESELFGYNRGAFTGASASKPGIIERANGGILFLDEIGDLSQAAQAKLLRVIQEKEIQRLGDTSTRRIDVRFLFATHKDLKKMVKDGTFREDLYYRISAHVLTLPPLRERKEDISLLFAHFVKKYSTSFGKGKITISSAAMRLLINYDWPGNVREIENITQSLLINCDPDGTIEADALPQQFHASRMKEKVKGLSLEEAREQFERDFLIDVLNRFDWNKTRAARELKVSRQGLINMIQRLNLQETR